MKSMMKRFAALFLVMLAVTTNVCALADQTICVTGKATVQLEPDMAQVTVGVTATEKDVLLAQDQVNTAMNQVIKALVDEMGIPEKDIMTSEYVIEENWEYNSLRGSSEMTGYMATAMLSVYVRDIDQTGAVIDAAVKSGANRLSSVEFMSSDDATARDQALTLAVQDGMHKAQIIAQAAGLTLPAVPDKVTEGSSYSYSSANQTVRYEAVATDEAGGTTLQVGLLSVTATVDVEYEID